MRLTAKEQAEILVKSYGYKEALLTSGKMRRLYKYFPDEREYWEEIAYEIEKLKTQ